MAKKKNKRIRLLSDAEIEDIYGLTQFDKSQRVHYFSLNSDEESELNELLFTHSKLHYILQLGYFKAKRRLFRFKYQEVEEDIDHVIEMYFPNESIPKKLRSRNAIALNNKRILQLADYQDSPKKAAAVLSEKTKQLTRRLTNPIVILKELFIHLEQQRFVFPEYSTLQDIVGKELRKEELIYWIT